MGTGKSGIYSGTYGSRAVPGSIDYMHPGDRFSRRISRRSDVDVDGYFDIVAHGTDKTIKIEHNGEQVVIDHRTLARLLKNKNLAGKKIRLLSCDTGKIPNGFAQGLAHKLGVEVKAPSSLLWAEISGSYFVADGEKNAKGEWIPIRNRPGTFITFSPKKRRK